MTEIDLDKEPPVLFNGGLGGTILLTYSFNITLYSLDMSAPQQKEAVISIFDEYASLYGSRMNWTINPVSWEWKPLNGRVNAYLTPDEWLMEEPEDYGYDIIFHGGKNIKDTSDVYFRVMAEKTCKEDKEFSSLSCRFPLADVRSGKLNLADLMHRWCAMLKPWHGRGGYSAGWWLDNTSLEGLVYKRLTDQLMFYPGLQYDGKIEVQTSLRDGPRCADWLIALSDSFLEKLGGLDAVTDAMLPCPVLPYEGGAVLQAGNAPGLGKDGDPASLPDYLRLGRVIEPVRTKNSRRIIYISTPASPSGFKEAQDLSEKWCTRFSGKK